MYGLISKAICKGIHDSIYIYMTYPTVAIVLARK
jgi:hypothetical protein